MSKLKTAYDLANERVIKPTYKMQLEDEYDDGLGTIPEFVEPWKSPHGKPQFESVMIEDRATESMIDKSKMKKEAKIENIAIEVKVQDPIKINYSKNENPSVHWYGHFKGYTGFSRMNRVFSFGLSNKGVLVKLDIQPSDSQVNEKTLEQLKVMENIRIPDNSPKIFGATIPLNMFHSGKKILYTMIENSGSLHPEYVGKLNLFDEIWVPTHFAKRQFKNNNVHPPIYVMPLGVDVKRYNPERKKFDFNVDLKGFVFLSVSKWGYRKGFDILIKSFLEEFSSHDDVSLVLVSRDEFSNNPNQIVDDFMNIRSTVSKEDHELPHIVLYDEEIPEKDMPNIYGVADAFCLISRGEGWSLPICEAGATGLPVIASNCSGQSDYLNHNNSFLVDPEGYVKAEINGQLSKLAKQCRFYEGQEFPHFGQKSIAQTKAHMRYVCENYDQALEKAEVLRSDLVNNYTWDHAIDKIYKRILELHNF